MFDSDETIIQFFFKVEEWDENKILAKKIGGLLPLFQADTISKADFFKQIVDEYPIANRADVYWGYKRLIMKELIEEQPKKQVFINKKKLLEFKDAFVKKQKEASEKYGF